MENIINTLHDDGIKYIEETVSAMSLIERQIFFVNCIKVIDKSYYDYAITSSDKSAEFFFNILKYAYPVLIKYLWAKDFEELPATPLARADRDVIEQCRFFLCSCSIIGYTEYILDMQKYGYISIHSNNTTCTIKYLQSNGWREYLDSAWINYYENIAFSWLQADEHIKMLQARWPDVREEMKPLCFVWLQDFMGYDSTINIENYFNDLAYYDALHSTEWDYFFEHSKFGGVAYKDFTNAIIDSSAYAIKHIYYAGLLQSSHPELLAENLFYNVRLEDETIQLIQENQKCSISDACTILSCISLSSDNNALYNCGQVNCAPFIKISKNQYLHSIAGSLFHPFSFLLSSLQKKFPNDISRNINSREAIFRKQLYEMFGNGFTCINHNIIIKYRGKTITDIDAAIVDKKHCEIAFFQLKWQNQTTDSIRSLHSKALNYNKETMYWVEAVKQWLANTSEIEIAEYLGNGIKAKDIDKTKIFLFVLGRNHGNYSGTQLTSEKTVWIQWFQLLQCFLMIQKDFTIAELYDMLQNHVSLVAEIQHRPPQKYFVDPYTIIVESIDD